MFSTKCNIHCIMNKSKCLSRLFSSSKLLNGNGEGWFDKLLVRKIEPTKESHSQMLSDKEIVYELQTHNIKPGTLEPYLQNYENYVNTLNDKFGNAKLCGSWTVGVGDQDQCLHLWKYDGGYGSIDRFQAHLKDDNEAKKLISDRNQFLRQRINQYILPFSFWPAVMPRAGNHIYEIRSYFLKPGTMIEWGNNWAKGIQFRQSNNEAYGGFFSQIGRLYNVHHIWSYGSMSARRKAREGAWREPGWDQIVAYTVPLLQKYESRIMYPTSFSPTQ